MSVVDETDVGRVAPMTAPADVDRQLARSDLPRRRGGAPALVRMMKSRVFWFILIVACIEIVGGIYMWLLLTTEFPLREAVAADFDPSIIQQVAGWAALSAVPVALACIWADRWRPHHLWVWILALGWGAAIATPASYEINTWMAHHLNVVGQMNPAAQSRPAIFVAPFVEEATKGSILFFVAIAMRNRWIGVFSGVSLAGLSGVGFAFVENLLYYARVVDYAASTTGVAEPQDALMQIFFVRGVMSWFAHPLFTVMMGIALAFAIRSRSKTVRILLPVAGFLGAALLHMLFNGLASTLPLNQVLFILLIFVAYPLVILVITLTIKQIWHQKRIVHARLSDYVRAGWLPAEEVDATAKVFTRLRMGWQALWAGRLYSTVGMLNVYTELAYLRDAILRGLVDEAGQLRERTLLTRANRFRARAIVPPWPKTSYPWQRWRYRRQLRRARQAGTDQWAPTTPDGQDPRQLQPVGTFGHQETGGQQTSQAIGGQQYSAVDPRWKPPA